MVKLSYPMHVFPYLSTAVADNALACGPSPSANMNPFNVIMLVTDAKESGMYKLISYNVSKNDEQYITEIPFRAGSGIAALKGKLICRWQQR